MNKNGYREEKSWCYFHPKQVVVGICPLCLNERLLILAAKQGLNPSSASTHTNTKPHTSSIHKIFAFASLFSRPDSHLCKSHTYQYHDSSPSPEDSFISIKFEENGTASWEKNSNKSNSSNNNNNYNNKKECEVETTKSVIERGKSREGLRWRKRIGHIFHLMRWKRPSTKTKGNGVEGSKKVVRKGWIRTSFTKRS